jgi:hypothetical protein
MARRARDVWKAIMDMERFTQADRELARRAAALVARMPSVRADRIRLARIHLEGGHPTPSEIAARMTRDLAEESYCMALG